MRGYPLIIALFLSLRLTLPDSPALAQELPASANAFTAQEQAEIKELELRARSNITNAALQLADILEAKERYPEAQRWYHYAFIQDSGRAGFALYDMYKRGLIKLENAEDILKLSIPMMEQAANNGDASSALILGMTSLKGDYIPINYKKAVWFLELARKQGKAMASYHLGNIYSNGLLTSTRPRKALVYYKEASERGVSDATRQLGLSYLTGIYNQRDTKQAISLLEKSIGQGNIQAMIDLANLYRYEENNMAQYSYWVQRAADAGNRDGQYYMGLQLENQNPAKAGEYFTAAADQGHLMGKQKISKVKQLPED